MAQVIDWSSAKERVTAIAAAREARKKLVAMRDLWLAAGYSPPPQIQGEIAWLERLCRGLRHYGNHGCFTPSQR